jgi:hypothetical protein
MLDDNWLAIYLILKDFMINLKYFYNFQLQILSKRHHFDKSFYFIFYHK